MNNEMKVRTSNILIAAFWVLVVAVWLPILRYVTTYGGYKYACSIRGCDGMGILMWVAFTGALVAAQYLIAGTVRFKFQKQ